MPSDYPANPPPQPLSRIAAKPTSADRRHRLWHPNNRPAVYSRAFVPQRICVISPQPFGGGRVAVFRFLPQQADLLRPEVVDTAGGHGGIGIVAFFVQYLLEAGRESDAPPFQFICPRGGIVITVGGQVFFGVGQQFFIGRHGIGSRWRMFLGSGSVIGHGGIFPAGGKEQ